MNKLRHIWKYLTSPTYRFWVDYCSQQEFINMNMALIHQALLLSNYPMFIYKNGEIEKL